MRRLLFFSLFFIVYACGSNNDNNEETSQVNIQAGTWRGVLMPNDIEIPFIFHVNDHGSSISIQLINADERIPLDEVQIEHDSIHIPMYIFDATIHARIENGRLMNGVWVKNYLEDYVVPFKATFGDIARFTLNSENSNASFDGKWEVDFISDEGDEKAIGIFNQHEKSITGTFILQSGDYRFLEGVVDGDSMKISCFDGTHAYLFKAQMLPDGRIEGDFWSGKSWHQKWIARRNDDFELADPYTLTFLKAGYKKLDFKFPNIDGDLVELSDERYKDKVVVVQILGTWCPNCMDETRFYTDWYRKNRNRGVEIIGLAFERKADADYASERIIKMKEKLGVDYQVLIAGANNPESKAEALPMINKILSFPTTIILDKEHNVRKIHTGFTGPGTGIYYERFVEEFNLFMDKLISE